MTTFILHPFVGSSEDCGGKSVASAKEGGPQTLSRRKICQAKAAPHPAGYGAANM
jgi:hypothetical protein